MKKITIVLLSILLIAFIINCSIKDTNPEGTPAISFEQFKQMLYKEPWEGGDWIIQGDIPIRNEEQLQAYYQAYLKQLNGERISSGLIVDRIETPNGPYRNLIPTSRRTNVTYCVSTSFSNHSDVVNAMKYAVGQWLKKPHTINVIFKYVSAEDGRCNSSNSRVWFNVSPTPSSSPSYYAKSFFPNEGRSDREILVNIDKINSPADNPDNYALRDILTHELGHSLGFRHEHIHPENTSLFCGSESDTSYEILTAYDSASVMHYPSCLGTGNMTMTTLDHRGAVIAYGLKGDINNDNIVDIFDLSKVASIYGARRYDSNYDPKCDINNDGIIDIFDLTLVSSNYGNYKP